ncbi:MAG: hypothetical protein QOJ40_1688 [Verrucomicrobiota bacterium]
MPELKQFGDLSPADFDRHPVWVSCHGTDEGQPWYEETDEETFRPWTGALPVGQANGMFLVRATFELRNGSRYSGFITPGFHETDLGVLQPHVFVGERCFRFWGGMLGIPAEERQAFYSALEQIPDAVFPLRFDADSGLATGAVAGQIKGFYRGAREIQVQY